MTKKQNGEKKYSKSDLEKIRKRATEIWRRKCQALNTALDDWLQAERELRATTAIKDKKVEQYTNAEILKIKDRAQLIHDEKVKSLRTAFDDWIEAEQELKEELKTNKIDLKDFFDRWFKRSSFSIEELMEKEGVILPNVANEILEKHYVELMAEGMN